MSAQLNHTAVSKRTAEPNGGECAAEPDGGERAAEPDGGERTAEPDATTGGTVNFGSHANQAK